MKEIICAWCDQEQGVIRPPGTSHGICARHTSALLAQVGLRIARDAEGTAKAVRDEGSGMSDEGSGMRDRRAA